MNINVSSPRGTDYGAVNIYVEDSASRVELDPTLRIHAMQGLDYELDVDEDELFGDETKKDVYARYYGVMATCKHGQIEMETLAAMLGTTLEEIGTTPDQILKTHFRPVRPPYMRLRQYHAYTGEGGAALLHTFTKVRVTSLTIKNVAKGYAEIEFTAKGKTAVYPHPVPSYLEIEARETGIVIGDSLAYAPTRQFLPLWMPDDSDGFTDRVEDAGLLTQHAVEGSTEGDYLEWTRPLGEGTAMLRLRAATGDDRGKMSVTVEGVEVGEIDLYDDPGSGNVLIEFAFSVFETKEHTIRLTIVENHASSTDDIVQLSSLELTSQNAALTTLTNILPRLGSNPAQIPATQYARTSGSVTVVTPAGDGGEIVQQTGIGEYIEYEVTREPGTYSIEAMLGTGDDHGILSVAVNGTAVGTVDTYDDPDTLPVKFAVPGTFTITSQQRIKIRVTATSKHASSTGYKKQVAWIQVVPVTPNQQFLTEDHAQAEIILLPWFADVNNGWTGAADTTVQNWVYSGSSDDDIAWQKVALAPGSYRATLNCKIQTGGANVLLQLDTGSGLATVATFETDGDADDHGKVQKTFSIETAVLATVALDKASGNAAFSYLYLERL